MAEIFRASSSIFSFVCGQYFVHSPQLVHFLLSMTGFGSPYLFNSILIAFEGQTTLQIPQFIQKFLFRVVCFIVFIICSSLFLQPNVLFRESKKAPFLQKFFFEASFTKYGE